MTVIGGNAFDHRTELEGNIDLSDTKVTEIGEAAFRETGLSEVVLTDSLEIIGKIDTSTPPTGAGAFSSCKNLKSVHPSSYIGDKALVLPDKLELIGNQTFRDSFVKDMEIAVTIPASVKKIGSEAFNSPGKICQFNIEREDYFAGYLQENSNGPFYGSSSSMAVFKNAAAYSNAKEAGFKDAKDLNVALTYEVNVCFKYNDSSIDEQLKLYNQNFMYQKADDGIWRQNAKYKLPSSDDMPGGYEYDWKFEGNKESISTESKVNDGKEASDSIDVVANDTKLTTPEILIEEPDGSYVHEDGSITLKSVISNKVDGLHYDTAWAEYNWETRNWDILPNETGDTLTITKGKNYYLFACEAYDDNSKRSEQNVNYVYIDSEPHNWNYNNSGNTVTVRCTQENAKCPYADHDLKLTLTAPDAIENITPYSEAKITNTITDATKATAGEIYYEGVDETTYQKSTTAPTKAGVYKATVTIGGKTAEKIFNIFEASNARTVTFDTKGGTPIDALVKQKDSLLTEAESKTMREDYNFAGWYKDEDLTEPWEYNKDKITEDITLYAKWTPAVFAVSGKVLGFENEDMADANVSLKQGDKVIKTVKAGPDGSFSFTDVGKGKYKIYVEKDDRNNSQEIDVRSDKSDINIQLPVGIIKTEICVNEGTPETNVEGLDNLEKDDKYKPGSNDLVHIVLNVTAKNEDSISKDTVSQIKALAGSENIDYLEMNIEHFINGVKKGNIKDTAPYLQSITINYDTKDKNISVYRVHENKAEKLAVADSEPADGTYRVNNGSVTIYATKFSIYAISYSTSTSSSHHSSSSTATYPVTVKSADHGTVTADKANAAKGAAVTLTVKPENGYALDKLTVTDGDGRSVAVTSKGDGKYLFVMPGSGVNVVASFADAEWNAAYRGCPKDATCPIHPFTDAKTTDWYHDGMHFCLENGLMVGYGNNILKPDTNTSRAMITAMLWRLSGSPVVNYAMKFSDVKGDAWYAEAVRWAASEGIVDGYDNGTFGPDDTITREQMAAVLWRYAKLKGYDVSVGEDTNILSYADVSSVAQYAIPAMQWACGSGMISGKTAGNGTILDPKGSTTRAQMSTMMMRFCAEIVK